MYCDFFNFHFVAYVNWPESENALNFKVPVYYFLLLQSLETNALLMKNACKMYIEIILNIRKIGH